MYRTGELLSWRWKACCQLSPIQPYCCLLTWSGCCLPGGRSSRAASGCCLQGGWSWPSNGRTSKHAGPVPQGLSSSLDMCSLGAPTYLEQNHQIPVLQMKTPRHKEVNPKVHGLLRDKVRLDPSILVSEQPLLQDTRPSPGKGGVGQGLGKPTLHSI